MLLLPIHLLVCSTLTLYTPLGVYGAALSIIVTYYLFALSVAVWIKRSKAQDCWGGWSWRSVKEGKGTFAGLWLPGVFVRLPPPPFPCPSTSPPFQSKGFHAQPFESAR